MAAIAPTSTTQGTPAPSRIGQTRDSQAHPFFYLVLVAMVRVSKVVGDFLIANPMLSVKVTFLHDSRFVFINYPTEQSRTKLASDADRLTLLS